jgi:hypothetical protein
VAVHRGGAAIGERLDCPGQLNQGQLPQLDRHEFKDRRAAPRLQNLDEDRKGCGQAVGRCGPAYSVPGESGQWQLVLRHFADRDVGNLHRLPTRALGQQLAQVFLRPNAKSCQVVLTVPRAGVHSDDLSLRR